MSISSCATLRAITASCAAIVLPTASATANEADAALRMLAQQRAALESLPAERIATTAPVAGPFKAVTLQPASGLHSAARGLLPVGDWRRIFPLKPGERSSAAQ